MQRPRTTVDPGFQAKEDVGEGVPAQTEAGGSCG